jgi:hypothetical protein
MKRLAIGLFVLLVCKVVPAAAEKPNLVVRPAPTTGATFTMGQLTPTPDMWFYEQYVRQYQDPKVAVRANAEYRANQRLARLSAMKWFGMSNQRPVAAVDSLHSDYSPKWASSSANYPMRWSPTPTVVVSP